RLSDTEYYVTTTSSGAGGMEQWFTWWNAVWNMDCQIVNVTGAIAAVNVAGPQARDALAKLTAFDLSNEAFPYLGAGHAAGGAVPKEGAQVIGANGDPVGRITSSRFSQRLGKAIGIAWVPVAASEEGTPITISDPSGARIPASVTVKPFYDPEGARLRS